MSPLENDPLLEDACVYVHTTQHTLYMQFQGVHGFPEACLWDLVEDVLVRSF